MAERKAWNWRPSRRGILLLLAILFAVLAASRLFYFSVIRHDELVQASRKLAMRRGTVDAPRGRILTEDGLVLAQTQFISEYWLKFLPSEPGRAEKLRRFLKKEFEFTLPENPITPMLIARCVSPDESAVKARIKALSAWPEIQTRNIHQRIQAKGYETIVGRFGYEASKFSTYGPPRRILSGLELKYDKVLTGTPGFFTVMVDRSGNWIPGTVKFEREPVAGKDVVVKREELGK